MGLGKVLPLMGDVLNLAMRKIYGGLIFFCMHHLVAAQTTFVLGKGTGACHPSCSTQGTCITGGSFESLIIALSANESITISSTA